MPYDGENGMVIGASADWESRQQVPLYMLDPFYHPSKDEEEDDE